MMRMRTMINHGRNFLPVDAFDAAVPADARPTVLALLAASAGCVGLGVARGCVYGQVALLGLVWNLFLAWVPLVCALHVRRERAIQTTRARLATALGAAGWFFFFPNAPYLVTDLIHLRPRWPVPLWFDALLLAGFAGTGLLLGYVSLFLLETPIRQRWGAGTARVFAFGMLAAGSFGVYLGRFRRWNSWDVVVRPHLVLWDSLRVVNPFHLHQHGTLLFCAVFSLLLLAGYMVLRGLMRMDLR